MPADPLPALVSTLAASDTDIQTSVRQLINASLRHCHRVMATGAPDAKMALMKAMVPALIKSLDKGEERDEILETMRAEMDGLYAMQRELLTGDMAIPTSATPVTSPPVPPMDREPGVKVTRIRPVAGEYSKPRAL